jgi:hypothetical protein
MNHFYENIDGWLNLFQVENLTKPMLPFLPIGDLKLAEIGVYKGRGTALFNVYFTNLGYNLSHYAIDHFIGSSEHESGIDYFSIASKNLKPIENKITIMKKDSVSASKCFEDEFFDIVYIDGSHEYEHVKADIKAWLPKVRKGGYICGDDYSTGWQGVVKAVDEHFRDQVNTAETNQWFVKL